MSILVKSTAELGILIRAVRKARKVRMDDIPAAGPVFVRDIERGKETAQIGRVLALLEELGIELRADIPEDALPILERLRQEGIAPRKPRRRPFGEAE